MHDLREQHADGAGEQQQSFRVEEGSKVKDPNIHLFVAIVLDALHSKGLSLFHIVHRLSVHFQQPMCTLEGKLVIFLPPPFLCLFFSYLPPPLSKNHPCLRIPPGFLVTGGRFCV